MTNTTEMPVKIRIDESITGVPAGGMTEKVVSQWPYSYTRTDTIRKITAIRWNPKGYWEALSDGSKAFEGYDERIEEEYLDQHPGHDDMVESAFVIVPSGEWQPCHPDMLLEEFVEHYQEEGYQVFVIPKPISKAEVAREFFETADKLAGQKMQRTGVIAGAHYAAMQQLLKEWEDAEAK